MKIGILTYHAACNFGANLQVLSTFCYLKKHGHSPIVIDWMPHNLEKHYLTHTPKLQFAAHQEFREHNLSLTKRCYTDDDVADVIKKESIEGIIVGSDAVMQHHPFLERVHLSRKSIFTVEHMGDDRMCPNPFWGSFVNLLPGHIPLCMMSVSSQNSAYRLLSPKERALLNNHLSHFDFISTRDEWTSKMVQFITRETIIPEVTPDPVFGFNYNVKEQFEEDYIRSKFNLQRPYMLFSFHDSRAASYEWLSQFQRLAESRDIECVALPFPFGVLFDHPFKKEIALPLSPLEWYALIKYSSGFVGHNMHPIVVCLHNAVPCFSFDNYGIVHFRHFVNEKSSKIYNIMDTFNVLTNRISCMGSSYRMPSAEMVMNRLMSFDRSRIIEESELYLHKYLKMMDDIISRMLIL